MKVPLLDLVAQHQTIREDVMAVVTRVFDSQQFVMGAEVASVAWGGSQSSDNIGLRMRDGSMEYVSFYLVPRSQWADARRDVLAFAARFSRASQIR